jgi:hypothetical protein
MVPAEQQRSVSLRHQKEKAAPIGAALVPAGQNGPGSLLGRVGIFQRCPDVFKSRPQLTADGGGSHDDGKGDERGDQAMFDGGRAGLVLPEGAKRLGHLQR